jgi:hypothetical protein
VGEPRGEIIRRTKDADDRNAIAVVDRVIQNLKVRIAEFLESHPEQGWAQNLTKVVNMYNATPHETVHGAPEDVRDNEIQKFLVTQDNSTKLQVNQELLEKRKKQLETAGAFRRPIRQAGPFTRGFKPSYAAVEVPQRVTGSVIHSDGPPIDIKRVQIVAEETDNQLWVGGLSERDIKKKDKLMPMMNRLIDFLADGEHSIASAAVYLKQQMGSAYEDALREANFGKRLVDAIRLFPQFELTKKGYYVKMA